MALPLQTSPSDVELETMWEGLLAVREKPRPATELVDIRFETWREKKTKVDNSGSLYVS